MFETKQNVWKMGITAKTYFIWAESCWCLKCWNDSMSEGKPSSNEINTNLSIHRHTPKWNINDTFWVGRIFCSAYAGPVLTIKVAAIFGVASKLSLRMFWECSLTRHKCAAGMSVTVLLACRFTPIPPKVAPNPGCTYFCNSSPGH